MERMRMRHLRWLAAVWLLGVSAPALSQAPPPLPSGPPVTLERLVPDIDAHFRRYVEEAHIPGLVYGIVRDGRLVHVGSMGVAELDQRRPVDADTLFRIA